MRLVNISEGWLQRVSVCARVSDREILSKPVNEMRRTPHHTRARTHTHTHTPSISSLSGGSVVSNLANWTGKPAVCFYMKPLLWQQQSCLFFFTSIPPSQSFFLLSLFARSLVICSFSFPLYIQYFHYSWKQYGSTSTWQKSIFTLNPLPLFQWLCMYSIYL